jgi:hypothetical protein
VDPLTIIVSALAAGAAAAAQEVAEHAVKDAYQAFKSIIIRRFGHLARVQVALDAMEQRPASAGRKEIVREELAAAAADQDEEIVGHARTFLELLDAYGFLTGPVYTASVTGSGAIAQGPGAVAAGEGGVAIGGDAQGDVLPGGYDQDAFAVGDAEAL